MLIPAQEHYSYTQPALSWAPCIIHKKIVLVYEGTAITETICTMTNSEFGFFIRKFSTHVTPVCTLWHLWYLIQTEEMYFRDNAVCA